MSAMTISKEEINVMKEIIELECTNNVKVVYAEKNQWLLLKTADRNKTFGAIRFNKNTFVSLYLDTKEDYDLSLILRSEVEYKEMQADIQSRVLGNFVQNKIKFFNEGQVNFVTSIINKVMKEDAIHITKKIRKTS